MAKHWTWTLALVGLAGISGCSGKSDDGGGGFSACGGDVTGTWQLRSVDFVDDLFDDADDELPPECGGTFRGVTGTGQNASITFDNGLATSEGSVSISVDFRYSPRCIEALTDGALDSATAELCAQVGAAVDESAKADDPNSSASCSLDSGGCSCTLDMTQDITSTDTYTQQGDTLIVDDSEVEYCVSGDELTLHDDETTMRLTR